MLRFTYKVSGTLVTGKKEAVVVEVREWWTLCNSSLIYESAICDSLYTTWE